MRHVDFSPLYRSTVGFDRLFTILDSLAQPEGGQTTYPPYNIERTGEDSYRISMAVAGFSDEEISIEAHRNVLTVKGERKEDGNGEGSEVLYRGIAARSFERRFQLADHVDVVGAALKNGLLHIDLKRNVPEELKPRKIAITAGAKTAKQIEAKTQLRLLRVALRGRRRKAPPFFVHEAMSPPKRSTSSVVVAKLVTKRQSFSPDSMPPKAVRRMPFVEAGILLLQRFHLGRRSSQRRPRWPAAPRPGADAFEALMWPASLRRHGVGVPGRLQPQPVLEIGIELRGDEARLREKLRRPFADEGEVAGPVEVEQDHRLGAPAAVLGAAEGDDVDAALPGHFGRRRLAARPARWRSARHPCAAAAYAVLAICRDGLDLLQRIDGADFGRLGDRDRRRPSGMDVLRHEAADRAFRVRPDRCGQARRRLRAGASRP